MSSVRRVERGGGGGGSDKREASDAGWLKQQAGRSGPALLGMFDSDDRAKESASVGKAARARAALASTPRTSDEAKDNEMTLTALSDQGMPSAANLAIAHSPAGSGQTRCTRARHSGLHHILLERRVAATCHSWGVALQRRPRQDGHRGLGLRRWDETLREHCGETTGHETPWQDHAQDREAWKPPETTFVARILRKAAIPILATGRFLMHQSEEWMRCLAIRVNRFELVFACIRLHTVRSRRPQPVRSSLRTAPRAGEANRLNMFSDRMGPLSHAIDGQPTDGERPAIGNPPTHPQFWALSAGCAAGLRSAGCAAGPTEKLFKTNSSTTPGCMSLRNFRAPVAKFNPAVAPNWSIWAHTG